MSTKKKTRMRGSGRNMLRCISGIVMNICRTNEQSCSGLDFAATVAAGAGALTAEEAIRLARTFAVGALTSAKATEAPVCVGVEVAMLGGLLRAQARFPAVRASVGLIKQSHINSPFKGRARFSERSLPFVRIDKHINIIA